MFFFENHFVLWIIFNYRLTFFSTKIEISWKMSLQNVYEQLFAHLMIRDSFFNR